MRECYNEVRKRAKGMEQRAKRKEMKNNRLRVKMRTGTGQGVIAVDFSQRIRKLPYRNPCFSAIRCG